MENSATINTASGEQIVLYYSAYPPVQEILEVLEEENISLGAWPDIALGYYRLNRFDEFVFLLEKAERKKTDQSKEQMRCIDLLAAYYVKKGRNSRNEKERRDYFSKATMMYTTADKLMMYDPTHLCGRAYFCLLEAVKSGQARAQFDYVINQSNDTSAIIGRALENYASGEYNAALAFFRRALRCKPDLPAEVRLGFGYCYLKLKNYEKAKTAFTRVIQLDPTNVSARTALAVCLFHENDSNAKNILINCHKMDKTNPVILNQLANIYFLEEDIKKAQEMAWAAYENGIQPELKAESLYLAARCHHFEKDYEKAYRYYHQATTFCPKLVIPWYGLGQLHLGKTEFKQAIDCFEKVLKEYPDDYETLKVLGSIYTRYQGPVEADEVRESLRKGEDYLRKVYEMNPEDVEVIFELAQLQESTKPLEALKKYEKGCLILEAMEEFPVPVEVYCNIGALHFQLGHFEQAKPYYEKAEEYLQSKNGGLLLDEDEAKLTAVQYNIGRLYESLCRLDTAEDIYHEILVRKPNHSDSILRLGCIWRERGNSAQALENYRKVIALDEENHIPHLFIANLHMAQGETRSAQTNYEKVLKLNNHKDDVYALTGLGNVWLEALYNVKRGEKDEKEKIKKFREHSMNCYLKVLKYHPHNAWAANGIGCVLVHKGQTQDAREIYSQVREAAPELSDVFVNLAHVHMDNRQYQVASQIYKNFMKRQNRQFDVQLLQYAARASWKAGNWTECRDLLQRAVLEAPDNLLVRYSLAIVIQCMSTKILSEHKATLEELWGAYEDLKISQRTFKFLSTQPDDIVAKYRYISRSVCTNEAQCCSDLLHQAKQFYNNALKKDTEERLKQQRIKAERDEQLRRREQEEREEILKQQQQEEELKKQRAIFIEKTKEILKVSQVIEDKEKERESKKKSGGRRKTKNREEDDFVNDSDDMGQVDGEERKKRKKEKRRKRKRDGAEGSGSEGENKAPKKKRKEKKPVAEEEPVRKGKVKSRAYVSSSSSSESENEKNEPQKAPSGDEDNGVPPPMSDDSDLSDSQQGNGSEDDKRPVKRARIDDSEEEEDNTVDPVAASPAESEDQVRVPPESDSD